MKNSHLKNAVVSAALAVFAGVLIMGVNAAIGATPGENPPGATISPTFDDVNIEGTLANPGGATITVDDTLNVSGSVNAGGDLFASGDVIAESVFTSPFASSPTILQTTNVRGPMRLEVTGAPQYGGNLWVEGSSVVEGYARFDDDIDQFGGTADFFGPLTTFNAISSINGGITAKWDITSQSGDIGNFRQYAATYLEVPYNGKINVSVACPAGMQIVSCGSFAVFEPYNTVHAYSSPSSDICYTRIHSTRSSGSKTLATAIAMCHDPSTTP